jgi:hypothetical protein
MGAPCGTLCVVLTFGFSTACASTQALPSVCTGQHNKGEISNLQVRFQLDSIEPAGCAKSKSSTGL